MILSMVYCTHGIFFRQPRRGCGQSALISLGHDPVDFRHRLPRFFSIVFIMNPNSSNFIFHFRYDQRNTFFQLICFYCLPNGISYSFEAPHPTSILFCYGNWFFFAFHQNTNKKLAQHERERGSFRTTVSTYRSRQVLQAEISLCFFHHSALPIPHRRSFILNHVLCTIRKNI